MKPFAYLATLGLAGALTLSAQTNEVARLKSDLLGHTMGGREKCWKFQSTNQIKDVVIESKTEDATQRVITISLRLQAGEAAPLYRAKARVEYRKSGPDWKVHHVGLLSLGSADD